MTTQVLQQITDSLYRMEDTGKVEFSILKNLNELRQIFKNTETKWLESKNSNSFYFYQGARNAEFVLDRMMERFEKSQEAHDNPKIAEDSLIIIPLMSEILNLTEGNSIDESKIRQIVERIRQLRTTAADVNLIQSRDKDISLLDKNMLGSTFDTIMEKIDIPVELENNIAAEDSS